MPTPSQRLEHLEKRRADLKAQMARMDDLRPGSLVERYRRCGKPGCHCTGTGAAGHGPSWSLTREVSGKTVTRVIPPEAVDSTRRQIAEHRRFRGVVREFVEASGQLCDAKLEAPEATSQEAAKKGASKKPSRPRSSTRSRR